VTTPLVIQHQQKARLLDELIVLRQQGPELDRVRAELQKLAANAQAEAEARQREQAELIRLRGELTNLRARAAEAAGTKNVATRRSGPSQSDPAEAPLLRVENWANIGFATPSAAFPTMRRAKANRETNVLANSLAWLDDGSKARIDSIFAASPEAVRSQYGSADACLISFFYGPPSDNTAKVESYRIGSEHITGDEAILECEFLFTNGSTKTEPRLFVRIGQEWREGLDLADRAIDRLNASLGVALPPTTSPQP